MRERFHSAEGAFAEPQWPNQNPKEGFVYLYSGAVRHVDGTEAKKFSFTSDKFLGKNEVISELKSLYSKAAPKRDIQVRLYDPIEQPKEDVPQMPPPESPIEQGRLFPR